MTSPETPKQAEPDFAAAVSPEQQVPPPAWPSSVRPEKANSAVAGGTDSTVSTSDEEWGFGDGDQSSLSEATARGRVGYGSSEGSVPSLWPTTTASGVKGWNRLSANGADLKTHPAPSALRRPGRGPRRANLQIKRFDPWSVLKLSLVLGVAMFFVLLVGVGVLYTVLDGMGVWDKLNGTYSQLIDGDGGSAEPLISPGRVFGIAAIVGAINVVLFSALATVGAFIYNVSADMAGGLEITLSERE